MKISKSKKELARIISENGGWRDGAEFAWYGNQTKKGWFGISKPWYSPKQKSLRIVTTHLAGSFPCEKPPNWHQTILSRAEYFHLYPAPDADGWIEWNGGECPVDGDSVIDVKLSDGDELFGVDTDWDWHQGSGCDIIAYRLHKPEQAKPEFCESVMRSIPEPEIHSKNTALTQVDDIDVVELKPTIEQLAADYRNAKDYADRKQQDADDAKAYSEAKLAELVSAGKEIGLVVSIETTESKCANGIMKITKRSQLELGDVIFIGRSGVKEDELRLPEGEYQVVKVGTIGVLHNGSTFYPDFSFRSWRFIRRP